jgi:hypothetical protein
MKLHICSTNFSNFVRNRCTCCPELLFIASDFREIDSVKVALRAVDQIVSALCTFIVRF